MYIEPNCWQQMRVKNDTANRIKSVTDQLDMYKREAFPGHFCNWSKAFRYCVIGVLESPFEQLVRLVVQVY